MREILFRGKTEQDEWVYGSFIPDGFESVLGVQDYAIGYIKTYGQLNGLKLVKGVMVEVDRETVGQYTGLTDKNGNKIFEGDIVEEKSWLSWRRYFIKFYDGAFCHTKLKNDAMPLCDSEFGYALDGECYELEVIGNIHDNPELLEVEND